MAVPYIFATIPNGQTIPLQYLDANFSFLESQISSITAGVVTLSGGSTGLLPSTPTGGNIILSGTLNIANGGTGSTTANGALNALLPSQASQAGKILATDGTNTSWVAPTALGVASFSGGTTGLTPASPTTGTVTLGGTLAIANGGTGAVTAQGATTNLLPSQSGNAGYVLSTNGSGVLSWIPAGGAATITVGSSPIAGGTNTYFLYDNAGFVGEAPSSGTGSVILSNNATISTPTVNQPVLTALRETEIALSIVANAITIDCNAASVFYIPLNANITTITFTNVPAAGRAFSIVLSIEADGTPRTITWPASVKWPSGVAPTLTSTAGKVDTLTLYTYDAGTKWYAFVSGQDA